MTEWWRHCFILIHPPAVHHIHSWKCFPANALFLPFPFAKNERVEMTELSKSRRVDSRLWAESHTQDWEVIKYWETDCDVAGFVSFNEICWQKQKYRILPALSTLYKEEWNGFVSKYSDPLSYVLFRSSGMMTTGFSEQCLSTCWLGWSTTSMASRCPAFTSTWTDQHVFSRFNMTLPACVSKSVWNLSAY